MTYFILGLQRAVLLELSGDGGFAGQRRLRFPAPLCLPSF
jgi:hypothetical protein